MNCSAYSLHDRQQWNNLADASGWYVMNCSAYSLHDRQQWNNLADASGWYEVPSPGRPERLGLDSLSLFLRGPLRKGQQAG